MPIGVDKQIELNPITIVKNLKSKTTGEYYDYNYEAINASYVRGGVIMETESIKDGSFYASSKNITTITNNLNEDWKNAIKKIIKNFAYLYLIIYFDATGRIILHFRTLPVAFTEKI